MKNLTDEEIVKALDICYNDVHCSVDCPYFNLNGRNFCQDKELYKDLKRIVQEHAEQKAEIERLTEENEYLDMCGKQFFAYSQSLQVQVDELTKPLYDEDLFNLGYAKAVKDTAKEIYQEMYAYSKRHNWYCLSPDDIEMFADKRGVEVE